MLKKCGVMEAYKEIKFLEAMKLIEEEEYEDLYVEIGGGLQPITELKVEYTKLFSMKFFKHEKPNKTYGTTMDISKLWKDGKESRVSFTDDGSIKFHRQ